MLSLDGFIQYAKKEFNVDIIPTESSEPDTFEKIFGRSFLNDTAEKQTMKHNSTDIFIHTAEAGSGSLNYAVQMICELVYSDESIESVMINDFARLDKELWFTKIGDYVCNHMTDCSRINEITSFTKSVDANSDEIPESGELLGTCIIKTGELTNKKPSILVLFGVPPKAYDTVTYLLHHTDKLAEYGYKYLIITTQLAKV